MKSNHDGAGRYAANRDGSNHNGTGRHGAKKTNTAKRENTKVSKGRARIN
jgi:hypothetical protein